MHIQLQSQIRRINHSVAGLKSFGRVKLRNAAASLVQRLDEIEKQTVPAIVRQQRRVVDVQNTFQSAG